MVGTSTFGVGGGHVRAPLRLGSTPAGLGRSWTVKNTEGATTGWQEGPHTPNPVGQQVSLRRYPASSSSRVAFPSGTQATEWRSPGLYPLL